MATPIAEKVVQPAVQAQHFSYCPTMDLIALATINERVQVFRLNGQEIFSVTERQRDAKVSKIGWKPDGQYLAVAWSNQTLCLVSSRTGKTVHRIDCSRYSSATITCIGWGVSLAEKESSLDLDDIISRTSLRKPADVPADLPRALDSLDVENLLPKLSPLSSGGIEDDLFSSRASLDTVFKTTTSDDYDMADVLVLGFCDGTLHLSIYDFFEIGTFSIDGVSGPESSSQILLHSFHPYSTTHTLLTKRSYNGQATLNLVNLDMRLLSQAARYISTLASKSTQMRNLLRYIRQVQSQICGDLQAALDLPRRFIDVIQETLSEKGQWTWVQAAYHVLVTGNCPDDIKEWLVDQLGERGHKRWDKAMTTGYESVRRLTRENLLPALERFMVLASRLRGLSRFSVSNEHLGLSTRELDRIIDTVCCLQFIAHQMLHVCNSELQQFRAYSAWLRQEIDLQASDSQDQDPHEANVKLDHTNALSYIEGPMMESGLTRFIDLKGAAEVNTVEELEIGNESLFTLYTSAAQKKDPSDENATTLPRLRALISHLDTQCNQLLQNIANTQRKGVRVSHQTRLAEDTGGLADVRMISGASGSFVQYMAVGNTQQAPNVICVYQIPMTVANGISEIGEHSFARLTLGSGNIGDLRFIDDNELLVSQSEQDSSRLLRINYKDLEYRSKALSNNDDTAKDFSEPGKREVATWITFPKGVSWTPQRVEVNGRKERRVACALAEDNFHYRVYDLDHHEQDDDLEEQMDLTGK